MEKLPTHVRLSKVLADKEQDLKDVEAAYNEHKIVNCYLSFNDKKILFFNM